MMTKTALPPTGVLPTIFEIVGKNQGLVISGFFLSPELIR